MGGLAGVLMMYVSCLLQVEGRRQVAVERGDGGEIEVQL